MRNADQTWPVVWWAQARDLEKLEGRVRAEEVWGVGYYADDGKTALVHRVEPKALFVRVPEPDKPTTGVKYQNRGIE